MASKEVSLLDETLIKLAASGKSGDEMEAMTGVPAPQAIAHVKGLMAKRDVWSEHERQQLLLHELNELKDSLTQSAVDFKDLDSGRLLLKTLELIGKRLDSQQVRLDEDVLRLSEFQQRVLFRALDAALNFAKKELAERYPQVSLDELDAIVTEGLVLAKYELLADGDK
jgi:hypothetical protein